MLRKNNRIWSATLAIFGVTAFLLIALPTLHMHSDEELSYRATNGALSDVIGWQTSLQDNQAPLWFILFNGWRNFVGDSELGARVFGILLVMPALAFVYRIARRGYRSHSAGILSVIALIGNHLFFNYALDIRPYPLVMLVSAISIWALQNWLLHPYRRNAIFYGIALAGLLYTHYLLIFFIIAQAIYVIASHRLTRLHIIQGGMSVFIGAILWLPWFPIFIAHVGHLRRVEMLSGTSRGVAGIGVSTLSTNAQSVMQLLNAATNDLAPLYGIILFAGAFALLRSHAALRIYTLALIWAILTPILYLLANLAAAVYAPRFVSHVLLGLSLAVGGTFAQLPARWHRLPIRLIAICALIGLNLATFPTQPTIPPRVPIRDVFAALSTAARPAIRYCFNRQNEMGSSIFSPINILIRLSLKGRLSIRRRRYVRGGCGSSPPTGSIQVCKRNLLRLNRRIRYKLYWGNVTVHGVTSLN